MTEALLCVLQVACLTIYNTSGAKSSGYFTPFRNLIVDKFLKRLNKICCFVCCPIGEVVSVPLSRTVTSVWPLPFGLLLQQAAEVNSTIHAPSSSSTTLFGVRDLPRPRGESGHSPQHNVNFVTSLDHIAKGETSPVSSHLILKDPLEEPHVRY